MSCCDASSSRVQPFYVRSWIPSALLACAGAGRKAASPPPQESTGRGESTLKLRECHCTWRTWIWSVAMHVSLAFLCGCMISLGLSRFVLVSQHFPIWILRMAWSLLQRGRKLATSKKKTKCCECLWTFCCPSSIPFHFEDYKIIQTYKPIKILVASWQLTKQTGTLCYLLHSTDLNAHFLDSPKKSQVDTHCQLVPKKSPKRA